MADARNLWRRCLRLTQMMPKAQSDYYYRYSKQVQALCVQDKQVQPSSAFRTFCVLRSGWRGEHHPLHHALPARWLRGSQAWELVRAGGKAMSRTAENKRWMRVISLFYSQA